MVNRSSIVLVLASVLGVVFANVRIEVNNGETKGTWQPAANEYYRCNPGAAAIGFQIQVDRRYLQVDKQGLTGIRLFCDDNSVASATVADGEGDLLPELTCRGVGQPYLVDFQLRVLPHKNPDGSVPDDEVAATDLKFRCSNDYELNNGLQGLEVGDWSSDWSNSCADFGGICGVQIRYDANPIPLADNSGINDVRFECCQ